MRVFKIQTLQDGENPMDPISILTGGIGLLSQLFPGLFNSRTRLTREMVNEVFPGNGYWTVLLKNKLLESTQWTEDTKYWYPFGNQSGYIQDFAYTNMATYAPECPNFALCAWPKFQQILKQEKLSGGNQPGGQYPGGMYSGGVDLMSLALVGGGLLLLVSLSKKKKRK